MSLKDIASLGKLLAQFLALFADCFTAKPGDDLLEHLRPGIAQRRPTEERRSDRS